MADEWIEQVPMSPSERAVLKLLEGRMPDWLLPTVERIDPEDVAVTLGADHQVKRIWLRKNTDRNA